MIVLCCALRVLLFRSSSVAKPQLASSAIARASSTSPSEQQLSAVPECLGRSIDFDCACHPRPGIDSTRLESLVALNQCSFFKNLVPSNHRSNTQQGVSTCSLRRCGRRRRSTAAAPPLAQAAAPWSSRHQHRRWRKQRQRQVRVSCQPLEPSAMQYANDSIDRAQRMSNPVCRGMFPPPTHCTID